MVAAGGSLALAVLGALSVSPAGALGAAAVSAFGQWRLARRGVVEHDLRVDLAAARAGSAEAIRDLGTALDAELEHIGELLDFESSERISLFMPGGTGGLRLVSRHSKTRSQQMGTQLREVYPASDGCLGTAWNSGEKFVEDLPDPITNPGGWIDRQLQLGVRLPQQLTMKTRTYYCRRLELNGVHVGVLVLESTATSAFYTGQVAYRPPKIGLAKMRSVVKDEMKPLCAIAVGAAHHL